MDASWFDGPPATTPHLVGRGAAPVHRLLPSREDAVVAIVSRGDVVLVPNEEPDPANLPDFLAPHGEPPKPPTMADLLYAPKPDRKYDEAQRVEDEKRAAEIIAKQRLVSGHQENPFTKPAPKPAPETAPETAPDGYDLGHSRLERETETTPHDAVQDARIVALENAVRQLQRELARKEND